MLLRRVAFFDFCEPCLPRFVFGMAVLAALLVAAPAAHAACRSPKNICKHFDDCLQRTSDPNNKDADGIRAGPFPAHQKPIQLIIQSGSGLGRIKHAQTINCSLSQAFQAVAEGALLYDNESRSLGYAAKLLLGRPEGDKVVFGFDDASVQTLRRELVLYGLIEIRREDRSGLSFGKDDAMTTTTQTVTVWRLTDYGRRQLAAIAP